MNLEKIRKYKELKRQILLLNEEVRALSDEIKTDMGDASMAVVGEFRVFNQTIDADYFDKRLAEKLNPDLVRVCTSKITYNRLVIN